MSVFDRPALPADLPKGDPAWSVMIWRQDSLILARLRPILEEIITLADEPCLVFAPDGTCLDVHGDEPPPPPCLSCRLKQLRARVYGYRDQA